ncbi:unnamed protein product [Rhizoctonia solani]|uniref:Uncharacterized protein n=1 Tax=Rhizoctonia solani TaxID=456999 RepID=A0A8H3BXC1_9AGAM|nr:unnamed protein product [Rhizoctonia solani]
MVPSELAPHSTTIHRTMTAFAGYYVAPEVWTAWMNSHPKRHRSAFGASAATDLIEESLRERKIGAYFGVQAVPIPPFRYIGLDVSRWRTLWFDEESYEAPYDAKFLKPKVRTERGDVNHKSGNGTRDKAETKTRSATGSEEEGEDQGGEEGKETEGAQAEDGKAEDHETQL